MFTEFLIFMAFYTVAYVAHVAHAKPVRAHAASAERIVYVSALGQALHAALHDYAMHFAEVAVHALAH